jgi:tetratricopeptide (TPR) repeat protein
LEELDKVFEMGTGGNALALVLKGMVLADRGEVEEGLESMKQACDINKGWYIYYGPYLFKYGRMEEGNKILAELEGFPESPFFNLSLSFLYHAKGDFDKTFEYLEKGKRHAWYPWGVRIYLADENLQKYPRYYELLNELNLPPPGPLQYDPNL